jgi:hypothetical protein
MKKLLFVSAFIFLCNNAFSQQYPSLADSIWKINDGKNKDFKFFNNGRCTYGYYDIWYSTFTECNWEQQELKFKISINNNYYVMNGNISANYMEGIAISQNSFYSPINFSGYATHIDRWITKEVPKTKVEPRVENKVAEKYSPPKTSTNDMSYAEAQRILKISPYGEDKSFIYIVLLLLTFLVLFLIFKFSKSKKILMKNNSRNLTAKVYSQQNSSFSFWHGQKGLALTFWGFFVGGNILFNAATIIFADNSTLIITNLIFFIIWNVLSVMGVFNAADIYKAEKIKQGLPYTPATAAKVAVVLLILSGIGNSIPR